MAPFILKLIPQHTLYCEPFCGGAAILFAKKPSKIEVMNDKNDLVANFYRACKTDFDTLAYLLRQTPHSRNAHAFSRQVLKEPDLYSNVRVARAFRVQTAMSYGSKLR